MEETKTLTERLQLAFESGYQFMDAVIDVGDNRNSDHYKNRILKGILLIPEPHGLIENLSYASGAMTRTCDYVFEKLFSRGY